MSAVFSPCRTWRYTLTRETLVYHEERVGATVRARAPRTVAFIGLNPSTADETVDDPTVRRCLGFARSWGFERMVMLNLFAYRSTDPRKLAGLDFSTAVGPENHWHLVEQTRAADLVVCAWGTHGKRWKRGPSLALALRAGDINLHVLGLTKDGHPKHPLYLRGDLTPEPWT